MTINEETIQELLREKAKTAKDLSRIKRKVAKLYRVKCPGNVGLLAVYKRLINEGKVKEDKNIDRLLIKKPVRSLSGIVNVSVLTKPYPCPGSCVFCPTERGFPKSYLAGEPAADRAAFLKFDPYLQTKRRLEALKDQGHSTDKIELRIIGGTFSFYKKAYQTWFIKRCFEACNEKRSSSLEKAQKINEKAKQRVVGISIETRPDFISEKEIKRLRILGITLVEMGVQSVSDDILEKNKTGLSREKIIKATKLLKSAGFKVLFQIMPNLPGSSPEKDFQSFMEIFENEGFKPDWLKIYPCVVCRTAEIYNLWQKKKYKPYSEKNLVEILIKAKQNIPYWLRLTRLFRDIPSQKIMAGCKISNLRENIQGKMKERRILCHCIRCREIKERYNPREKVYLFREDYLASGGKEIFLSFENKKRSKLFSFLRLRINNEGKHFLKAISGAAIIREVQTFGLQTPISKKLLAPQHKGFGKRLIFEAEKIAKTEFNKKKIAAIAGVGVRGYYRKLGYRIEESYMAKSL